MRTALDTPPSCTRPRRALPPPLLLLLQAGPLRCQSPPSSLLYVRSCSYTAAALACRQLSALLAGPSSLTPIYGLEGLCCAYAHRRMAMRALFLPLFLSLSLSLFLPHHTSPHTHTHSLSLSLILTHSLTRTVSTPAAAAPPPPRPHTHTCIHARSRDPCSTLPRILILYASPLPPPPPCPHIILLSCPSLCSQILALPVLCPCPLSLSLSLSLLLLLFLRLLFTLTRVLAYSLLLPLTFTLYSYSPNRLLAYSLVHLPTTLARAPPPPPPKPKPKLPSDPYVQGTGDNAVSKAWSGTDWVILEQASEQGSVHDRALRGVTDPVLVVSGYGTRRTRTFAIFIAVLTERRTSGYIIDTVDRLVKLRARACVCVYVCVCLCVCRSSSTMRGIQAKEGVEEGGMMMVVVVAGVGV
ncbi:hypothetical protein BC628DRAFT_156865 [Trametes gibbosa]|nr:hypothetical protein BC628DRAFT_156865 [Trametes gibbosa]